jgi:hypothetical protein
MQIADIILNVSLMERHASYRGHGLECHVGYDLAYILTH